MAGGVVAVREVVAAGEAAVVAAVSVGALAKGGGEDGVVQRHRGGVRSGRRRFSGTVTKRGTTAMWSGPRRNSEDISPRSVSIVRWRGSGPWSTPLTSIPPCIRH